MHLVLRLYRPTRSRRTPAVGLPRRNPAVGLPRCGSGIRPVASQRALARG